ncbi:MAG: hypothetical protein IPM82_19110 [Saprospiraceae bacterium]|nr:hypothetical protein [Saprospiraceae bacterium]
MLTLYFLIVVFFLLRLYGITNPPLEVNHNWRQVTTNMYARNFLEVDDNPLYCRVDMAGDLTGITAKEFPLFNYLIYVAAEVFGWQHWYGRLISLVVSSFGVWFFYLLVKNYVAGIGKPVGISKPAGTSKPNDTFQNQRFEAIATSPARSGLEISPFWSSFPILRSEGAIAYPATVILLSSIWFGHSRIIMPDTFSVSLVLAGLWFGREWLHRGGSWRLVLFGLLGTLGALSKLPSGFLLAALAFPFFDKTILPKRKIGLAAMGAVLLACCGWWYFWWLPQVIQTYGFEHYPMRSLGTGMREILNGLPTVFERFYRSALKSYVGFGLYVAGLGLAIWRREWRLLGLFGLLSAVFVGYMFKSGSSFYHHNYYIIPFVPVMAVMAGFALAQIPGPWLRNLLLLAVAVEGIANQQDAFRIKKSELPKLQLEPIADSLSQRSDLVAFYSEEGNPHEMYFAHRKGWLVSAAQIKDTSYLADLRERGCRLLFINKKSLEKGKWPRREAIYEDDNYLVFRLVD